MSLTTLDARDRAAEIRALRARIGLGVKMLTNAGYAMIGGTFFRAVTDQHAVPAMAFAWGGAGVGVLILALWFAPHGSDAHD